MSSSTACQWFDGAGLCGQVATHVVPGRDPAPVCAVHAAHYSQAVRVEDYRPPAPKVVRPHPLRRAPRELPRSTTCDYLVCGDDGRVRCEQPAVYRGVGSNRLAYCRRHAEWVQSLGHAVQRIDFRADSRPLLRGEETISPSGLPAHSGDATAAEPARAGAALSTAPDATPGGKFYEQH